MLRRDAVETPDLHKLQRPRRGQRARRRTKCQRFAPAGPWPCNCFMAFTRVSERVHVRDRPARLCCLMPAQLRPVRWMPRRNRRTRLRPERRHGGLEPRCRDTLFDASPSSQRMRWLDRRSSPRTRELRFHFADAHALWCAGETVMKSGMSPMDHLACADNNPLQREETVP